MKRILLSALLVSTTALAPLMAYGFGFGGIVFDPQNYTQNLYTASRTLVQIRQQVNQLQNEARMILNQTRNLTRLDFSAQVQLMQILDEISRLNREAKILAYDVVNTKRLITETFPEDYSDFSSEEAARKVEAQWVMARDGYHQSMVMQSALVESLDIDRFTLDRLVSDSQSATGNLSATQSTNQLLALLIKQNMTWQQMRVAGERAEALSQAHIMATEQESRAQRLRFVGNRDVYQGGRP